MLSMPFLQTLLLSTTQGISEFLPISSSGHLILTHHFGEQWGWKDPGLPFDVALHIGSAIAVILYFRKDLFAIIMDSWQAIKNRQHVGASQLGVGILIATFPAIAFGLLLKAIGTETFRSVPVVATMLILFALVLGWATLKFKGKRQLESMTLKDFIIIGLMQAIALIPGTSRSGITISAGLFRGLSPATAARFSFLLSLPAILLAGAYESLGMIQSADAIPIFDILLGIVLTAIVSFLCIHFLLELIRRFSLVSFVIYRLLLGGVLWIFFT